MNEPVIPLQAAYMCADGHISTDPCKCVQCGSDVMSLARALNRKDEQIREAADAVDHMTRCWLDRAQAKEKSCQN